LQLNGSKCNIKLVYFLDLKLKKFLKIVLISFLISNAFVLNVFAVGSTLLPYSEVKSTDKESAEDICEKYLQEKGGQTDPLKPETFSQQKQIKAFESEPPSSKEREKFLSCAIRTGDMHLWMMPYYMVYVVEFIIQISGIIAVLMFVVGGFMYILGGVSETFTKEKGKTTMQWALLGMCLTLLAWVITNVVLGFVSQ
jgi:hypothetical protein